VSTTRTANINALRALLGGGNDADRALGRARCTTAWLATIRRRRATAHEALDQAVRRAQARRLATEIAAADKVLADNRGQLVQIVETMAPGLTARVGIGPISAAQALVSWSHPGRCRSDAAFAALAGANPIPASSGRTVRHRLNRGGDRALNRALHDITLTRWRCCPRTRAYITRRRAEGKTDPEIRRCLKRYIARELFGALQAATA